MSFNRTIYDSCQYSADLVKSTSPLYYQLDPSRFYNCNKCMMLGGIVGGPTVSHSKDSIIDVESQLFGINKVYSRCPTQQYQPQQKTYNKINGAPADNQLQDKHLKTCYFVQHPKQFTTGIYTNYPSCNDLKEISKKSF